MNTLDYLFFTGANPTFPQHHPGRISPSSIDPTQPVSVEYAKLPAVDGGSTFPVNHSGTYRYSHPHIEQFMSFTDTNYIDKSIAKHWNDVIYGAKFAKTASDPNPFADFGNAPVTNGKSTNVGGLLPHHLIYAYMLENTRIVHIFERVIQLFYEDETLTKADDLNVTQLIFNTEKLFYDNNGFNANASIISNIRDNSELVRRNAYYRMFGLGINWGDYKNKDAKVEFHKAQFYNNSFVATLEAYLSEFWKAYINIKNTSGPNSTDLQNLRLIAQLLREQLMARRSNDSTFVNAKYGIYNLSREEVTSCVFTSWLHYIVGYNSPLIKFLRCEANSAGDRLINLGNKVGLPAHSKSVALFDLAHPLAVFLRSFELKIYENSSFVNSILMAYTPAGDPTYQPIQDSILNIIDNWEISTGRSVKGDTVIPNNSRLTSIVKSVRIEKGTL